MTPRQTFKAACLLALAREGVGPEEAFAKLAAMPEHEKAAFMGLQGPLSELVEGPFRLGQSAIQAFAPMAGTAAITAGVGVPVAGGLLAGHLLAKAQDDDTDVEAAKADELIRAYGRLEEEARRRRSLARGAGA